jgi:hypothetical protein
MRVRNVLFACLSLGLLAAASLEGCGSSTSNPLGTLGAACYADNRCNAELTCVNSVCVTPGPGGTAPTDGGADAADAAGGKGGKGGAGGASGAGGSDASAGHDAGDAAAGHDGSAGADAGAEAPAPDAGAETGTATDAGTDGAPATDSGSNEAGDGAGGDA